MHWQPRIAHLMPVPRESRPAAQRHVRHARSCSCLWAPRGGRPPTFQPYPRRSRALARRLRLRTL